jgi:hypothetical protein
MFFSLLAGSGLFFFFFFFGKYCLTMLEKIREVSRLVID